MDYLVAQQRSVIQNPLVEYDVVIVVMGGRGVEYHGLARWDVLAFRESGDSRHGSGLQHLECL